MKNCTIDTRNFIQSVKKAANETRTSSAVIKLMKQFLLEVDKNRGMFTTKAPVDPWRLAEECKIEVVVRKSRHDGQLFKCPVKGSYVIVLGLSNNPKRQNFTLAHEIGHFILISKIPEFYQYLSYGKSLAIEESMCNLIASELLMPIRYSFPVIVRKGISPDSLPKLLDDFNVSKQVFFRRIVKIVSFYYNVDAAIIHWDINGPILNKSWTTDSPFNLSTLVLGFDFSAPNANQKSRYIEDRLILRDRKLVHVSVGSIFIGPSSILSLVWPKNERFRSKNPPPDAPSVELFFKRYFSSTEKKCSGFELSKYDHPIIHKFQERLSEDQFRDLESQAELNICPDIYKNAISRHKKIGAASKVYNNLFQLELIKLLRSKYVRFS